MPSELIESMDVSIYKSNWKKALNRTGLGKYYVVEANKELLAFSTFGPSRDRKWDAATVAELVAINVTPSHWRSGIGTYLLNEILQKTSVTYNEMYLWVVEENTPARRFYEKNGFRLTEDKKLDPKHGLVSEVRYCIKHS